MQALELQQQTRAAAAQSRGASAMWVATLWLRLAGLLHAARPAAAPWTSCAQT